MLPADRSAKAVALHWFATNLERHFGQDTLRQIKVLESILPALLVRAFAGTARTRQISLLFQTDVLSYESFFVRLSRVITISEPRQKVRHVPAGYKHMSDNPKVSKRRRVDVENGNSLRLPERNEIKTVQPAHDTNHVDVFL